MEAATPLHPPRVRVLGDRLVAEGLVVEDPCAVRLAAEAADPVKLLVDAIEVGARIIDREDVGAQSEVVRAEFEAMKSSFTDRAKAVADRLDEKVEQAFGAEDSAIARVMARHFGDESSQAVQHKLRAAFGDVAREMREDLRRQLFADGDDNPLAKFHRIQLAVAERAEKRHTDELRAMREQLEAVRLEFERERAEKQKLEEVAAERDKGTAKGRTFEELVHEALDGIALAQGDDCDAVGDLKEGTGKKGDVVVAIGACHGPARGRIVFEVKTSRLSRPKALEELEGAKAERNADYAVLVVPSEDKVPAKMLPLREYNGDKLIVAYDPEDPSPIGLQVAYSLARARVLMAKGGGDGVDTAAVRDAVERALGLMDEVRRIKQQLTASKTSIDKAAEIVQAMADGVRAHLSEIDALVISAEAAAADDAAGDAAAPEPAGAGPAHAPDPPAAPVPSLRDELAGALPGDQSSLL
jgi:Uncharacterized protein conserved in bacteria (DUF2130)